MVKLNSRRRRVGGNEDDGDEKALEGFEECKMASRPQLTFFLPLSLLQIFTSSAFPAKTRIGNLFYAKITNSALFCVFVVLPLVHNLQRWSDCKPFLCKFEEQKKTETEICKMLIIRWRTYIILCFSNFVRSDVKNFQICLDLVFLSIYVALYKKIQL